MKITIHPLFFIFGLYFALVGKVFLFLTFTLTALIHELGHAFCAERLGYKMNEICLMPTARLLTVQSKGYLIKMKLKLPFSAHFLTLAYVCFLFAFGGLFPKAIHICCLMLLLLSRFSHV